MGKQSILEFECSLGLYAGYVLYPHKGRSFCVPSQSYLLCQLKGLCCSETSLDDSLGGQRSMIIPSRAKSTDGR